MSGMNEIFVGAKVIYKEQIYKVKELPNYCKTGWWLSISDGTIERDVPFSEVIMPEGLNEEPKDQLGEGNGNIR